MKITLYYAPGACSLASHIALEESGLAYEAVKINTAAGEQRAPAYLKVNPRGRVPTLVVDGKVLVENVAILTWVAGGHPQAGLWPKTTWEQAQAVSMMAWFADTVHPAFAHVFRAERYVPEGAPSDDVKAKGREAYWDCLKEIDRLVAGRRWTMGRQFTAVDGYIIVFCRWANRIGLPVKELANLSALVERILARPAVKKVMADEGIAMS